MEEFDENLDLTIVDFMRKIRTVHIHQQSAVPSAVGAPQYESDTTPTTLTDEEKEQKLQKFIVSNNLGKPNLRAAFLNSSLREAIELMRPANALLKRAPSTTDRLSDVHHVFIIDDTTGKPLFELTPGCVLSSSRSRLASACFGESSRASSTRFYRNRKLPAFNNTYKQNKSLLLRNVRELSERERERERFCHTKNNAKIILFSSFLFNSTQKISLKSSLKRHQITQHDE